MFGRTTNSPLKNFGWARRAILSFSYKPLDAITALALTVVGISFLALLAELILRIVDPHSAPKGFTTVIVVILFIGGIQLLCIAIIGSYLAHMYEEVKGRPPFVVESVINPPQGAELPEGVVGRGAPAAESIASPTGAPRS
jgi:dolichol-phosphate mannosyltransferase